MAGTLTQPIQASTSPSTPTVNKAVEFISTDIDPLGLIAIKRSDGSVVNMSVPAVVSILSAGQAISAAAATLITGSVISLPSAAFQVGTTFRWTIVATKGAVGTAARTFNIRIGTTGTVSDAVVAAITSAAGTAVGDAGIFTITMTVVSLGAAAAAICQFWMTHNLEATGWSTTTSQVVVATMSTFNSTVATQFVSASITTGAAETATINSCMLEILKP